MDNSKEKKNVRITKSDLKSMLDFFKNDNSQRIKNMEAINEFGQAFIIKWNELEISLKLNYYDHLGIYPLEIRTVLDCEAKCMTDLIQEIKSSQNYSVIFGRKQASGPLKLRNKIVHYSYTPSENEYKNATNQTVELVKIIKMSGINIQNISYKSNNSKIKATKSTKTIKL